MKSYNPKIENGYRVFDDQTEAIRWKHKLARPPGRMLTKCPFCNEGFMSKDIAEHRVTCKHRRPAPVKSKPVMQSATPPPTSPKYNLCTGRLMLPVDVGTPDAAGRSAPKTPAPVPSRTTSSGVARPESPGAVTKCDVGSRTIQRLTVLAAEREKWVAEEIERIAGEAWAATVGVFLTQDQALRMAKQEVLRQLPRLSPKIRKQVEALFIAEGWRTLLKNAPPGLFPPGTGP